ncbi:hypothetical protein PRIPAC_80548 [Pristionchus pacificus]|nr:hypothetical protein PRIPAC_80548 [Pristionchus pacificus]|eukprot:PDM75281.1 hypothetical protein PRIPAC_43475 [Pristionchus pacificus]
MANFSLPTMEGGGGGTLLTLLFPLAPNIYLCSSSSLCCVTRHQPACCERDVSFKHVLRQSIPFIGLLIGFLLVAGIISWYYNDDEIIDDDENGDAYKKKISIKNILFPSSEEDVVDDPIFGRVWDETAPRYSRVSDRAKRVGYLVDGEETKKKN